jgi:ribonuclease G
MLKELIVGSSQHETQVAILEDDQLAEVYFERSQEHTIAGAIYKGRVKRVLPGMQSAFVDIGLERDAFLYVSDFLEDTEEYDKIVTSVEDTVARMEHEVVRSVRELPRAPEPVAAQPAVEAVLPPPSSPSPSAPPSPSPSAGGEAAPEDEAAADRGADVPREPGGGRRRRSRRRRFRDRGFPESKYASRSEVSTPKAPPPPEPAVRDEFEAVVLPGESLAKYRRLAAPPTGPQEGEAAEPVLSPAAPDDPAPAEPPAPEHIDPEALLGAAGIREQIPAEMAVEPVEAEGSPAQQAGELREEPAEPAAGSCAAAKPMQPAGQHADQELAAAAGETAAEARIAAAEPQQQAPSQTDGQEEAAAEEVPAPSFEAGAVSAGEQAAEAAGAPQAATAPGAEGGTGQAKLRGPADRAHFTHRLSRRMRRRVRESQAQPQLPRPAPPERPANGLPLISDLLREGQEIIVQIAKEPLGKKGARITSHVALPGRYVVYMPTVDHVGVSRKIATDEERLRLKRIILESRRNIPGGFIVRTAAEGCSEEELKQDIQFLHDLWLDIRAKAERKPAPALLHHDLDLVERILRDQLSGDFNTIWVDNEQEYENILEFVQKFQPALVHRVKLYTKDTPIFEEFSIQEEINKALKPKVWLKSGGYIVINQTEALVAIDVNTGKFVGKTQRLEDTIVKTNVDAIKEIVRQIRLRDLGGIIVIDFIDMDERKNRVRVMQALEEALCHDRAPSKMLAFNDFGLVAITRKRVKQSLERALCAPCSVCGGSGFLKSPHTVAMEILAEAGKLGPSAGRKEITLRVHPEVGRYLKQRDVGIVQEIEEMTHKTLIIRNDPNLHQESFDFN